MSPDRGPDCSPVRGCALSPARDSDQDPGHWHDHSPEDDPDSLGIVRFAELPIVAWRNGGGVTREVAADGVGPQDFEWRVSIADVSSPGPFSAYPGVDRVITLVEGERMDLVIDGVEHVLGLHESLSFDGASQTSCTLAAGPTRDLNVMTRHDQRSATVAIRDLSETRPIAVGGSQILVLLTGLARVHGDGDRGGDGNGDRGRGGDGNGDRDGHGWTKLRPLDAVCPSGPSVRLVRGTGRVAFVRIESNRRTAPLSRAERGDL